MNLTSKLILHLDDDRFLQPVPAVQGDTARSVEVALYAEGQPWDIPTDATASIRYRRSDGAGNTYDTLPDGSKAWSIDGNTVTIVLAPEVLAVSGTTTMQVAVQKGEAVLSTFSFLIQVQANPSVGASAPGNPPQSSGSGTVDLQPLTFTGAVDATYDGTEPVTVNIPTGDGDNASYTLPVASPTTLGGVKPVAKTAAMTQSVGVDADGRLYTEPSGGGGGNAPDVDLNNYYTKEETDTAIADAIADIGSGVGGEYRLIYELIVDENNQTAHFAISKDMDGNDFALSHLFVEANVKASTAGRADCYLELLGTGINRFSHVFNRETAEYNHYLSAEIVGNTLMMDCVRLSPGTTYLPYSETGKQRCPATGLITGLQFTTGNFAVPNPIGSVYRIYGY